MVEHWVVKKERRGRGRKEEEEYSENRCKVEEEEEGKEGNGRGNCTGDPAEGTNPVTWLRAWVTEWMMLSWRQDWRSQGESKRQETWSLWQSVLLTNLQSRPTPEGCLPGSLMVGWDHAASCHQESTLLGESTQLLRWDLPELFFPLTKHLWCPGG